MNLTRHLIGIGMSDVRPQVVPDNDQRGFRPPVHERAYIASMLTNKYYRADITSDGDGLVWVSIDGDSLAVVETAGQARAAAVRHLEQLGVFFDARDVIWTDLLNPQDPPPVVR